MYSNTYMTNKIRNQLRNLEKFTAKKFDLKEWDWNFFLVYINDHQKLFNFFQEFFARKKWHSNSNQFQNSRMIIY